MEITRYLLLLLPLLSHITVGKDCPGSPGRCGLQKRVEDVDFIDGPGVTYKNETILGNPFRDIISHGVPCHIALDGQPVFLRQSDQKNRAARSSHQSSRRAAQNPVKNIISMKTVILALHVLGAAESPEQITQLCGIVNFKRITDNGLDGAMLEKLVCKRNDLDFYLPARSDAVKELLSTWYTGLWLQILYVAFAGHYPDLCKIFETKKMSIIHMNGTLLEQILCSL
ncbi:hypothetical protein FQN49_006923 [Arthroderma sp. PD_2]|nr:hypothetical protein FQN49_006923 [Arthroderma sp. PD_2]